MNYAVVERTTHKIVALYKGIQPPHTATHEVFAIQDGSKLGDLYFDNENQQVETRYKTIINKLPWEGCKKVYMDGIRGGLGDIFYVNCIAAALKKDRNNWVGAKHSRSDFVDYIDSKNVDYITANSNRPYTMDRVVDFTFDSIKIKCDNAIDGIDVLNREYGLDCKKQNMLPKMDLKVTDTLAKNMKRYITVHDWSGGKPYPNIKNWIPEYWKEVINYIVGRRIAVIQLGGKDERPLPGAVQQFMGTDIKTSLTILNNALLHVDIEGSLVHACTAMGKKCIALHGPTSSFWRHKENVNIVSPHGCTECEIKKPGKFWTFKCQGMFADCMSAIKPNTVIDKINENIF